MSTSIFSRKASFVLTLVLVVLSAGVVRAQTTEFTYQGKLIDGGNPANSGYDFEFQLFDSLSGGTQQGPPLQKFNVQVTSGIFTVQLDFGNQFNGAIRFLDIKVKVSGSASFTPLTPRQQVTSNPYAIWSLNSSAADGLSLACVNCVSSSQIQSLQGSKITGEIPVGSVPAGSTHYIRNDTSLQAADIYISGAMSANGYDSTFGYSIGGGSVLSTPGVNNTFVGLGAGAGTTTGANNAFFGTGTGQSNSTGGFNTFVGRSAGQANTTGGSNSFFGRMAGAANTSGFNNAFFGTSAGAASTGQENSFFGALAGMANTTGIDNTFVGYNANPSTGNLSNATAIGAGSVVSTSNTIVLGRSLGQDTVKVPGILDAATHYNIAGSRVLSIAGTDNTFAGRGAGTANSTGNSNAFFGRNAGLANTGGGSNSLFGTSAGQSNTDGANNSFFGRSAGQSNTTGDDNSFFGRSAGVSNTTGNNNSFFGRSAGLATSTGTFNSFFGSLTGDSNTTGTNNTFLGAAAGGGNTSGSSNTLVGLQAGESNTTGDNNAFFGVNAGHTNTTGSSNTYIGYNAGGSAGITNAAAIGANAFANLSNQILLGTNSNIVIVPGGFSVTSIRLSTLASSGITAVCRNANNDLATCSSSLRYKTNIAPFNSGLSLVNRLRPITFDWKEGGMNDLGLGAEDVAAIEPLLVTYNKDGQVEGVKYDRIGVVLLNAVKEQQQIITAQQQRGEQQEERLKQQEQRLESQQREIELLKSQFRASRHSASRQARRR